MARMNVREIAEIGYSIQSGYYTNLGVMESTPAFGELPGAEQEEFIAQAQSLLNRDRGVRKLVAAGDEDGDPTVESIGVLLFDLAVEALR